MTSPRGSQEFTRSWRAKRDQTNYSITLRGRIAQLTRDDGTPESFGQNDIPLPRLLQSDKWKAHIAVIYGHDVLREVIEAAMASIASSASE